MKFAMGTENLTQLAKQTAGAHDDLGELVRLLARAGEPLDGAFTGAARKAYDHFAAHGEAMARELNDSLAAVLAGITEMERSFTERESDMMDDVPAGNFDASRFSASRRGADQ